MIYVFEHPETGEKKEVSQGMNDEHVFEEDGVKWNRVFLSPQLSIDTKLDPYSSKSFVDKTAKGGTLGDLFDRAKEASEMRIQKEGKDEVVEKEAKKYNKETGLKHMSQIKSLN